MRSRGMLAAAAACALGAALVCACGYRLVQRSLPGPSVECVRFEGLAGGGAHPQVAVWTAAVLREQIAPDLCTAGEGGPVLAGEVEAVEPVTGLFSTGERGPERMGGRWLARASVRIERGGETLWGPMGVEVEREFITTGSTLAEMEAFEAHLRLLSADLAAGLADVIYGVHPVTVEASD